MHTASDAPRTNRVRRALRIWHRIFGLGASLWLILLALTGSAIAFYDDLDTWLNPDWRRIAATQLHDPNVDDALANVRATLADFAPRFINLPNAPGETLIMLGSATVDAHATTVQTFSDPRDNRLLGWRDSERFSLHPRHLMDFLYVLHTELLLHETGVWLIGLLALLWMVDHIAGLVLALPRLSAWLTAFKIGGHRFNLRHLYDLHRAPALWLLPATFTLALTGWCLSWYSETRTLMQIASPVTERLHESFLDSKQDNVASIGIDAARYIVTQQTGAPIDSVVVLPRKGVYGVRTFDSRDIDDLGRLWTYISMDDGRVMGQRHDIGNSAGDTFFAWQYPLHSGRAFGMVGQAIVSVAGLATAAICLSGVWLWWQRGIGRRRDNRRNIM